MTENGASAMADGPLITVLLPSRGRPTALAESVGSLLDLADQPNRIQIRIAADPDDPGTRNTELPQQATIWTAPERYGYSRLHEYVNRLAEQADGDWLMLWNDDARILTAGWDTAVARRQPTVLWPHSNDIPTCNTFPIWPRIWTDRLGHVSLSPHCDSWIQYLGQALDRHERVDVEILHDRADLTGGHDDQTRAESSVGYRTADYGSPVMEAARAADVATLRALLDPEAP
ncbi:glycosyltransferase family 2 protein [Streptomyces sp. NPDC020747]|uniref:glycosyltransferase family 2 protein n=1 Tax=Streptomyces sp. NPDC020747 TaxID=3365086 RepID=UPI003792BCCA